MKREADKIVKELDIVEELENRGCKGRVVGDNYMMLCPFHDEKTASFGVRLSGEKKGVYHCYGCHAAGGFLKLLAHLDGVSFSEILQRYSDGEAEVKAISGMQKQLFAALTKSDGTIKTKVINEKFLRNFEKPRGAYFDYLKGRGINKESIKKFGLLCCTKEIKGLDWRKRIIIPVRNHKGKLVSLTARSIKMNASKRTKVRKLRGASVRSVLFGLWELYDNKNLTTLVLVEGEMDCIYLQQFGIPAVCIGRKDISDAQARKIATVADEAVISLDGGVSKEDVKRVKNKLKSFVQVSTIKLPKKLDPNELSERQVEKFYRRWAT